MRKNKYIIIFLVLIGVIVLFSLAKGKDKSNGSIQIEEMNPAIGDIRVSITTTGEIEPQNRLEIMPAIAGRVEEVLVSEGDKIKKGDILAWMSSTDRAALIDAARAQGEEVLKYWEEVYKKTPIVSPIDGEVIVRSVEPGQTVTTSDDIVVLSDRLIVSAQFDETDIGSIKVGQKSIITLDAYPEVKIDGVVDHIAYESELVNNVNIYNVDILPKEVPEFFRSGMSVDAEVIAKERDNVMIIPLEATFTQDGKTFVRVKKTSGGSIGEREISVGLSDETNVEVISGLTATDVILVQSQDYIFKKKDTKTSPFMPKPKK